MKLLFKHYVYNLVMLIVFCSILLTITAVLLSIAALMFLIAVLLTKGYTLYAVLLIFVIAPLSLALYTNYSLDSAYDALFIFIRTKIDDKLKEALKL